MAPPNPKRPPRPPRPPGQQASSDDPSEELPFDDDEVAPLQADDPRPQRVPQYPAGPRKAKRRGPGERSRSDRELTPRYDWAMEYSDPGLTPAFVYVERGPGAGQLVPLRQGSITLGRSSTSDLRLQHASISRRHAQLTRRGNVFMVRDLGSQNGTFVNRLRIKGEVEIKPGDELSLGNATLRLRGPGAGPTASRTSLEPLLSRTAKRPLNGVAVAVAAAVVGSAVAALISVVAMRMGERAPARTPAEGAPTKAPGTPAAPANDARETEAAASAKEASIVGEEAPAKAASPSATDAAPDVREHAASGAGGATKLSAADVARGLRPGAPATVDGTTGAAKVLSASDIARRVQSDQVSPSASDIARRVQSSQSSPSTLDTARRGQSSQASPSASDIALGAHASTGATSRDAEPGAREVAKGAGTANAGEPHPDASGRGIAKTGEPHPDASGAGLVIAASGRKALSSAEPSGPPDERQRADILARYESGDVAGALAQAKRANLTPLVQQLTRFQTAETAARTALAQQDRTRAIDALSAAVRADQELSQGWSRQGVGLRRQLAGLYVRTGQDAVRAQRFADARAAFTAALQHDTDNSEARSQLAALETQAP
ncbi:FHA domain-containing protein [Corallococcus sp. AS-1-6]|uniref:FHA domain-containing protein n=1 Tax=Corallococcus sp. AS-1-6 TaxID=2874599 RepID=UPI001CC1089E|nr:FHA domain-containing protein [Corallococcus sp. AS-1-6]MBZ4370968.1 FHA domain-containing protein [Corallococcus sp. AS-1-6]